MDRFLTLIIIFILAAFPCLSLASPYYGANFSYVVTATEPENLHGYQFLLNYDPQCFKWRQFNLYFDAGFSRLWINYKPLFPGYSSINIYTLSPVLRYSFKQRGPFTPYLELSIGLSYMNRTKIDDRNLDMHFAFQDRFGIGVYLGTTQQVSLGLHAAHYSNAHLGAHNAGITIPIEIDLGYRFS